MAEIVNLRLARKRKARAEAVSKADENRMKFGQKKVATDLRRAETKLENDKLDGHKLDDT